MAFCSIMSRKNIYIFRLPKTKINKIKLVDEPFTAGTY
jgi:hypothetical protein